MLTDRAKMTLPIALSTLNGQYNTEYNVLMAGSLISMIPPSCCSTSLRRNTSKTA